MTVTFAWRGSFTSREVNALHAEAFQTRVFDDAEWDWAGLVHRHSLGWVVARAARGRGIGTGLVEHARRGAQAAGCEYLHVDFEDHLAPFYYGACGFQPASGGLIRLS